MEQLSNEQEHVAKQLKIELPNDHKEKVYQAMKDAKFGERARVLFDMLADHLKLKYDQKGNDCWEKMKAAIDGETKANLFLMKMSKTSNPKKKRSVSSSD